MMFLKVFPSIMSVIILVSILLYFIPQQVLLYYLGSSSGILGYILAGLLGSVSLIPGFIAYPLAGILVKSGVSYPIIAMFITTLMMVGVVTLPLEARYFGFKVALLRNILSFLGAVVVGILIGLVWNII
ncbi:MAG: permease [Candidatus Margulisiibacteriota bacterium]